MKIINGGKIQNTPLIMIDFGGVYFSSAFPLIKKFSKKLGISEKKIREAFMGTNWTEHATGNSTEEKYWRNFSDKLKISEKQMQKIRKEWYSYSVPNDGMANLVKKLKKKYKVTALSSIISGWIEFLEKKYKISKRFHDHHYSYNHGVDKPDAKLFLSAARKMNVKPEDCVVVDDNKKFLAAVKKTGARIILFKDAKHLEKQLMKIGVEI